MRLISLNLNGIRSAANKGALDWLGQQHADVICVQELKAQEADLSDVHLRILHNDRSLPGVFYTAQKKAIAALASTAQLPRPESFVALVLMSLTKRGVCFALTLIRRRPR